MVSLLRGGDLEAGVTLEDVVEAVRQCRGRASALAYLHQECQICFSTFPMSKVSLTFFYFEEIKNKRINFIKSVNHRKLYLNSSL